MAKFSGESCRGSKLRNKYAADTNIRITESLFRYALVSVQNNPAVRRNTKETVANFPYSEISESSTPSEVLERAASTIKRNVPVIM